MGNFPAIDTKKNVLHNNIVWERHKSQSFRTFNIQLNFKKKSEISHWKYSENYTQSPDEKKEENQDSFKIMYENEIWRTTGNKSGSMIRNFQTNVVFRTQRILYRTEGKKKWKLRSQNTNVPHALRSTFNTFL